MAEDKMTRIRNLIDKFTEEMATDPSETIPAIKAINREEVDRAYTDYVAARLESDPQDALWFIQQTKMFLRALLYLIGSNPNHFGDAQALCRSLELANVALGTVEFRPTQPQA